MIRDSVPVNFDLALQEAFRFSGPELAENRRGNASPQQNQRQNRILLIALTLLVAGIVSGVWFTASTLAGIGWLPAISNPWVLLSLLIISILVCGLMIRYVVQGELLQQLEGAIDQVQGDYSIEAGVRKDKMLHTLKIGGTQFTINGPQTDILRKIEDRDLIVYYFVRSRQVASVEIIWDTPEEPSV